jgi:hypothetical protein
VGTGFTLHYQSDRQLGNAAARTLIIPLSGATVPNKLQRIDLKVFVAGQTILQSFPAIPNQSTTVTWSGRDAYGRPLQGFQAATVMIGYVYWNRVSGRRFPRSGETVFGRRRQKAPNCL